MYHRKLYNGFCCQLNEMVESPVQTKYRSKCEFTISADPDNNGLISKE